MNVDIPEVSLMLRSREQMRYTACDARKVISGRFLTKKDIWLQPQIADFITKRRPTTILDPFAGEGDMLQAVFDLMKCEIRGLDIVGGTWPQNDSLLKIPELADGMIVTNPPYLAKHSAKRKGVLTQVETYYSQSGRNDLYQIALDRCLESCSRVVAIVPETILNSGYNLCNAAHVTILHDNPFADTEVPVCVVCFDQLEEYDTEVFVDDVKFTTLSQIESKRLRPMNTHNIRFNVPSGRIGLRAVDMPSPDKPMCFMPRSQLDYDVSGIKISSRLVTFVEIPQLEDKEIQHLCQKANTILTNYREETAGLCFSPFKGNNKHGIRRRRLDYASARAILEKTLDEMVADSPDLMPHQQWLIA